MEFIEDFKLDNLLTYPSKEEDKEEEKLLSLLNNSKEFKNQYSIFASYMSEKELKCYPIDKSFNPEEYKMFKGDIKYGNHGGIWKKDLDGNWRVLSEDNIY